MHLRTRLATILLILAALALTLTACGADPTATPVPPTPTATPAPTATPPATATPEPTPTPAPTLGVPATPTTVPTRQSAAPAGPQPTAAPAVTPPAEDHPLTADEIACIAATGGDWTDLEDYDLIPPDVLECLSDESLVRFMFLDADLSTPGLGPDTVRCLVDSGFARDLRLLNAQDGTGEEALANAMTLFLSLGINAAVCLPPEDLVNLGLAAGDVAQLLCLKELGLTGEDLVRMASDPVATEALMAQCPLPGTGTPRPPLTPYPPTLTPYDVTPEGAARNAAAANLGSPPVELTLVHWQPHTWSNGCRGCTAPDSVCTEAEVEGFIAVYEHQETGRSVRVHVDKGGAPAFATTRCYGGPDP